MTAGNWSPSGVPNSSAANLIFGAGAGTTNVTLSTPYPAGYVTAGSITFNDPASAYSISVSNNAYLSVTGNVVNTSGVTQNFSVTGDTSTGLASEIILNGVSAGSNVTYTANVYGTIQINGATTDVSSARFVLNGGSIAYSGSGVLALGPVSGVGILAYYGNPGGSTGTFQLGGANDSATLTAQIQEQTGTAAVQKIGTGTLTLDGPSTYTGGTMLTSGGLLVGNNTALGTGNLSIASGTLFGSADGQPVSLANTVTLAAGSETIDTTGGDLTLTGAVTETGGSAALTKTGGNALVLAADETYSGGTTISAGTLQLGNGGTAGSVLGNIVDNGTLNFDRSDNIQFGQVVSGTGGIGQIGTGTVTLTAVNSFTGAVNVATGGTLALSGTGSIATASGVNADGTFDISGATSGASIKSLSGAGAVNLGSKTLTLTQAGGTFSGAISGSGGLTVSSGTEILTGSNGYTGTTRIAGGSTLQLGNGGAGGSIAGAVADNGTLAVNLSGSTTIAGTISGTGSVDKAGAGTLILSGNNNYSGGTVVTGGTLSLTNNNAAGSGAITLDNGTALALANGLDVTNALTIMGNVDLIVANGSAVESGVLTGNGTYTLSGGGTLHLTGDNSGFTGTTVLSGLTVDLATNSALGTGPAKVTGDTILHYENGIVIANKIGVASGVVMTADVSGSDRATQSGAITGRGGLAKIGTGTFVLTGTNTYSGGTTISAGTLQLGNGGTRGSIVGNVVDNGTLVFDRSDNVTFTGTVSGAGQVEKVGTGSLTLTGNNSYSGGTTISAGTLQLGKGGTTGSIVGNVADNGILAFDRSDDVTFAGAISGAGRVEKDGAGSLTLTGNSSYSGITRLNAGTLMVGSANALGTSAVVMTAGTTLGFGGDFTLANLVSVAGNATYQVDGGIVAIASGTTADGAAPGHIAKTGAGTLILTGVNAYSGGTTIAAGTLQLGNGGRTGTIIGDVVDQSVLSFDHSDNLTFAGTISGTGRVEQDGAGSLTLIGNSSYSGGTVLNSGSLVVGNANAIGTGTLAMSSGTTLAFGGSIPIANAITVAGNAAFQVDPGVFVTLNGAIADGAGTGDVVKTGAGTLILTGTDTYGGGTTISAGTLQLGNGGATGSIVGNVANNGVLAFDRSGVLVFAGAISGAGRVEKDGAGSLTLTGNNSYAGGTTLHTGSLVVGSANALGTGTLAMAAGTTLGFGGNFTLANAITVTGDPTFQVGAGIAATAAGVIADGTTAGDIVKTGAGTLVLTGTNSYSGGTTISAGTLQIGNGGTTGSIVGNIVDNGVLAFNRSDAVTFGNQISGVGTLRQIGTGTLTLSGNDAAFAGNTEVAGGTLSVTGTLGGTVAVDSGAILAGTGTVGSTTIASGGTLSPAGAGTTGTLTIKGNLTLATGSTYLVDAAPAGKVDLVHATGTASLGGNVASVAATGNWLVSTRYTILTADTGVSGKFGSVTSNFAFLTPTLTYDGDDVFLTLVRNNVDFASLAVTLNQRAVANGLASLAGGALENAVVQLSTREAPLAFNQLTGEIHASVKSVLFDDSRFVRDAGIDRIRSAFGGPGASTASVSTFTDGNATAATATVDGPAFWSQGYGSWGHDDTDGNAAKATHSTGGFLVGADAPVAGGWRAGILGGYGRTTFDASGAGSSDNYSLGVYGGNQWGALGLRLGMAYSWNDLDTHRSVAFTGFRDSLSAGYDAQTVQGFGDLGYKIPLSDTRLGQVALEPFVGLAYVGLHTDGFAERGGAAALSANAEDAGEVFSTLGLRASDGFAVKGLQLSAIGTVGWRHSYNDVAQTSTLRFAGSGAFTVAGVPIARDAALIEAGLSTDVTQAVSLSVTYTGQFGGETQDQGVRGTIAWKF